MSQLQKLKPLHKSTGKYYHIMLAVLVLTFISQTAYSRDFFISPDGDDNNDGSLNSPLKNIGKGVEQAYAGDTIFLRGGLYNHYQTIRITHSGQADNPITLRAYQNEIPILDFQHAGDNDRGINITGDYWHLKNLIIQHAGDNGLIVYGSHNILEQITTYSNGDSGIQLHTGASYNLVINCDSFLNYDPENHGENADGFAAKFSLGPGNIFSGCRAWSNSDDGFDFWEAGNCVTLENCWAFRNGENIWDDPYYAGDGNGFKLGHGSGGHILTRCVAYDNPHNGIDVNGNTTGVSVFNCTSVMNQGQNFRFDEHSDTHILCNNISHLGSVLIYDEIDDQYNTWNGLRVSNRDFVNLDPNGIDGEREYNGGLPKLSFLRLSLISSLVDAGLYIGLPFEGDAPDLGAFELIEGDCEPDGDIDLADLEYLVSNWLDYNCGNCNGADLDGNGKVDFYDFTRLADNWSKY
jgi:hypothetical protein